MKTQPIACLQNLLFIFSAAALLLTACAEDDAPQAKAPDTIDYRDFSQNRGLNILGNAFFAGDTLRLTKNDYWQTSACWYGRSRMRVADGFETSFEFIISGRDSIFTTVPIYYNGYLVNEQRVFVGFIGADGFTFVIQNAGVDSLGNYGYEALGNSLVVEFDTYYNEVYGDPNDNHVSIHSMGKEPNTMNESASKQFGGPKTLPVDISDGNVHEVKITYASGTITIFLDDVKVHSATIDLGELLELKDGAAYVGFTSFTGASYENHDILSWSFEPTKGE